MNNLLEYEKLVYGIICKKYNSRKDKDDLYQVGMIGLINACNNYDKSRETKFSTYAYLYILGEIDKYVNLNKTIKMNADIVKLKRSIVKCQDVMRQRLGREATLTEISLFLEIDEEKIIDVLNCTEEVSSIDQDLGIYDNASSVDKMTNPDIMDLKCELEKLSLEDKKIIKARYYQEMTQSEVSKILGISQVQVSRKEDKILKKLRSSL